MTITTYVYFFSLLLKASKQKNCTAPTNKLAAEPLHRHLEAFKVFENGGFLHAYRSFDFGVLLHNMKAKPSMTRQTHSSEIRHVTPVATPALTAL